jgi:protocatechuate 3,4-dioxygenase beta subunit
VLVVRHDEAESRSFLFPPVESGRDEIDFGTIRVGPGALVAGVVLDDSGVPVRNASVHRTDEARLPQKASCDEQARFELTGISAGRVQLRASAEGTSSEAALTIDVGEDAIVEGVTLTMPTGLSIAGRVIDASGRPVRDARLLLRSQVGRQRFGDAVSGEDGRFRFAGLDASLCTIQVTPPESPDSKSMTTRVESVEPGNSDLEIVLREGHVVAGDVVDAEGQPIPGAYVLALAEDGDGGGRGLTDRDGAFRILTASAARVRLEVRVYDRKHPIPLMQQAPVATIDDVQADGPPETIVVDLEDR